MLNSPCFNKETKTDCPDRKGGCAVNCPKWAKYVEEREEEYQQRKIECDAKQLAMREYYDYRAKVQRRRIRNKWSRKNYKG